MSGSGRATEVESTRASHRALVVEDDPMVRQLEEDLLTRDGYAVDTAGDGRSALERLAVQKYDVIVLDLELPEIDGYEIALRLRAVPLNRKTPLVMVTGTTDPAARKRGFEAGVVMFMTKPFSADRFRAIIATVVP